MCPHSCPDPTCQSVLQWGSCRCALCQRSLEVHTHHIHTGQCHCCCCGVSGQDYALRWPEPLSLRRSQSLYLSHVNPAMLRAGERTVWAEGRKRERLSEVEQRPCNVFSLGGIFNLPHSLAVVRTMCVSSINGLASSPFTLPSSGHQVISQLNRTDPSTPMSMTTVRAGAFVLGHCSLPLWFKLINLSLISPGPLFTQNWKLKVFLKRLYHHHLVWSLIELETLKRRY